MTLEGQYEYYRCVQHDFNEAYKLVNKYVTDLYVLPKKFIDDAGPALDRFIKDYTFADTNHAEGSSFHHVLEFIDQLDDFTEKTMDLFNEHKKHTDRSREFLKRVSELNQKNSGRIVSEYAVDYIELTPELTSLHGDLKKIKNHADDMVERLEKLELRWENIRVKVRA